MGPAASWALTQAMLFSQHRCRSLVVFCTSVITLSHLPPRIPRIGKVSRSCTLMHGQASTCLPNLPISVSSCLAVLQPSSTSLRSPPNVVSSCLAVLHPQSASLPTPLIGLLSIRLSVYQPPSSWTMTPSPHPRWCQEWPTRLCSTLWRDKTTVWQWTAR